MYVREFPARPLAAAPSAAEPASVASRPADADPRSRAEPASVAPSPAAAPGRVLLWIHGLGDSGLCFEGLAGAPELAGWRQLVPDLPGYGRSPWPPRTWDLAAQADHLAAWLRERGEPPAVVAGHSQGGVHALLLAERHPDRVAGVVDIDGNKSLADCVFSGAAARQTAAAFVEGGFDRLRRLVYRAGQDDPAQRGYFAGLLLCDPRLFHANSCELVALSRSERLAARLAALDAPSLYVAGVPGGASKRSLDLLAEADVAVARIEPSGHCPFLERPAEFLAVLRRFLTRWD